MVTFEAEHDLGDEVRLEGLPLTYRISAVTFRIEGTYYDAGGRTWAAEQVSGLGEKPK